MTGVMGFGEIDAHTMTDQDIKHAPQQMGAAPAGGWIEDDQHPNRFSFDHSS